MLVKASRPIKKVDCDKNEIRRMMNILVQILARILQGFGSGSGFSPRILKQKNYDLGRQK